MHKECASSGDRYLISDERVLLCNYCVTLSGFLLVPTVFALQEEDHYHLPGLNGETGDSQCLVGVFSLNLNINYDLRLHLHDSIYSFKIVPIFWLAILCPKLILFSEPCLRFF